VKQQESPVDQVWQDQPVGRPKIISDQYLSRLKELVDGSPRDFGYPFQRWTAQWLKRHLAQETGVEVSDRHVNRLLKQMGLSTRSNPHPTPDAGHRGGITIGDLSPS
jgi:transposase